MEAFYSTHSYKWFSGSALLATWCSDRRGNPLCHDAAAAALTAAQAFHKGADGGVGLEAEAGQGLSGKLGFMPAVEATDNQYATGLTQHGHHSFNADTALSNRDAGRWNRAVI
jgi:hypothetical protein